MADDVTTLELLQGFHQVLLAVRERRISAADAFEKGFLLEAFESELERLWRKPPKSQASRTSLHTGTDNPMIPDRCGRG
jgi:nuclear pore complex protein Nup205